MYLDLVTTPLARTATVSSTSKKTSVQLYGAKVADSGMDSAGLCTTRVGATSASDPTSMRVMGNRRLCVETLKASQCVLLESTKRHHHTSCAPCFHNQLV